MSRRPYVIGVTGNIACGKSLVLDTLAKLGAETIDADRVAHEVMAPGTPTAERVIAAFGEEIRGPDGGINRRALGAIVFRDPDKLALLDSLAHPPTVAAIRERVAASTAAVVAIDAIKLFEAGVAEDCDEVWVVTCTPEQQVERLMRRNGFDREEALRRIQAQPPQEEKVRRADRVIDNSGTVEDTVAQVKAAWDALPAEVRQRITS
ncbi:dephospho-CoA kinase [Sphaerobacter thermophilus]|jgi:dephospho-CoA kinase|uniref:Dephospho-CoA kinase n=1 Tax=Sphaerobacter thermophilus (strain ATCC 49802 / DSM 20745 / KCCM 41009 / NCIMB 13125 / S 6022) TaxID=479434 RepID=D1C1P6_SPHTD|nr:dephospho-CoA kinase [Sphaerobacter thermophilus]ACZ38163.1 dephospho-CoA kinase [Sphaerobacter thermophilus DSM 20745]PZN65387.1 MAG: dephospho-CoA kinase [Sphaerobacter thermophilus]